ncbi:MAG TPA: hypothetical protein ENN74_04635 [Firmicutes bacterium]|nr:hypothetical protein [Bacillota bacterium]
MPKLLVEMKHDLAKPEHCDTREFFISQREWLLNAAGCFVYYENDHPGLQGKIHVLENLGYVVEITAGDTPKYRMTEEFVQLVLAGR